MRGFLKNSENYVSLSPKITTIGREGCDVTIQVPSVDAQHAVIECNEVEDCFVLKDLNSTQGTYVNDVRVQNAAVRLAPGDIIRFGYPGIPYEIGIEQSPGQQPPQNHHRSAWTQPLTTQREQPSYYQHPAPNGLPCLTGPALSCTLWSQPLQHSVIPTMTSRPPVLSRPASAGTRRTSFDRKPQPISGNQPMITGQTANGYRAVSNGSLPPQPPTLQPSVVSRGQTTIPQGNGNNTYRKADTEIWNLLNEKEQKITQLTEEVGKLKVIEQESSSKNYLMEHYRQEVADKDVEISELRQELSEMSMKTQVPSTNMHQELTDKLISLEFELKEKTEEVFRLERLQASLEPPEDYNKLKHEFNEKAGEVNALHCSLEQLRKDKSIMSGLVTQLQRDLSSRETTISRLTRETENMKCEARDREREITNMQAKIVKLKENEKAEESNARERELVSLRQKFKSAENKTSDQEQIISSLKNDIEAMRNQKIEEHSRETTLRKDYDSVNRQLEDLQTSERLSAHDLEQTSNRLFRFRREVLRAVGHFRGDEASIEEAAVEEISDDDIVQSVKSVIETSITERERFTQLEKKLEEADGRWSKLLDQSADLRQHITSAMERLKEKGRLSRSLQAELDHAHLAEVDESLRWVRDTFVDILTDSLEWERRVEDSLGSCGVDVSLTNKGPGDHILQLWRDCKDVSAERDVLRKELSDVQQTQMAEVEKISSHLRAEHEAEIRMIIEKSKLEGDKHLSSAIDEIRLLEERKRDEIVRENERRQMDYEEQIEHLREDLSKREEDTENKMADLATKYEETRQLEERLRHDLDSIEAKHAGVIEKRETERKVEEEKLNEQIATYREEIRQHSLTIVSMETKLQKAIKKQKDATGHVTELKKTIQDLKNKHDSKPAVEKSPVKLPHEIAAMEHALMVFRHENMDQKHQLARQQEIILNMRRDLDSASARISDVTGEISEKQKMESETNQDLLRNCNKDLCETQQKLAKLSHIVDKQKDDIRQLEKALEEERSQSAEVKSLAEREKEKVISLEEMLTAERNEQKKQLELLEKEGKVTSELTALGAQCRGERHEKVIVRQREALAELRGRIKTLEQTNPPLTDKVQALQQVLTLKKELNEMQNSGLQTWGDNMKGRECGSPVDCQVGRVRGLGQAYDPELNMEKDAHRDSIEALEYSEISYLSLLRATATSLELTDARGSQSMANIPRDERKRLLREREEICEEITRKIKTITARIHRKDDLLQGYDGDLAKMRKAQDIAQQKSADVENLTDDVRRSMEEAQYLRECLRQTKEALEKEKRLNNAIKQKKTFHLENEKAHLTHVPKVHRCQTTDVHGKDSARLKQQGEQLKRKEYEVRSLKQQLYDRERQILEKEHLLASMEANLA